MLRFKYQFRPAAQARASEAALAGFAKFGKAAGSTFNAAYRPTACNAPQSPFNGSKGCFGVMPVYDASSPVNTHPPDTSQAVLCRSARKPLGTLTTCWSEI